MDDGCPRSVLGPDGRDWEQVLAEGGWKVKSGRLARRVLLWMVAGLLAAAGQARAESEPVHVLPKEGCGELRFQDADFIVCRVDLRKHRLRLWLTDEKGEPFGYLWRLREWLRQRGQRLRFAMNAGMYDEKGFPVGLYVEEGRERKAINLKRGYGNFHLMPNGVFWVRGQRAGVMESKRFARLYKRGRLKPDFATQSGPMLVINGRLHPRFRAASDSRKIRNGVGVRRARGGIGGHEVFFAISRDLVNFHTFARLFRDVLKTPDALFLDGTVSRLWTPRHHLRGLFGRAIGPIVGVSEKMEERGGRRQVKNLKK